VSLLGFLIFYHAFDGPVFEIAHVWAPDTSLARHEVSRADNHSDQKGEEAQRLSDFIENLQR
jgi:hypothetical protein